MKKHIEHIGTETASSQLLFKMSVNSIWGSVLTLELVLVLICTLVLSDQNLGGHIQTDNPGIRHQEEHDKLLAHDAQRFVLPVATSYG